MKFWLLVFLGGGLGSLCRAALSMWFNGLHWIPAGTFIANLTACFLLGFAVEWVKGAEARWFWAVGFCGGFSTFSTFSLETYVLWEKGQYIQGMLYATFSFLACLIALSLGLIGGKYFQT